METDEKVTGKIICHLDMDAFFASIEERYTPAFRGKPIAVGSDPQNGRGRGVVSTANYLAREYGIHSAMPISKAWQLSEAAKQLGKPEVVFVQPDFEIYHKSSKNVFAIIRQYANRVEQASVDEFFFSLNVDSYEKAEKICKEIKTEIKDQEKVTCSVGIGPNRFISKIAAGFKKPDGFYMVRQDEAEDFLAGMDIRKIPGIGPKTAEQLRAKGINKVGGIKQFSPQQLKDLLGKWGLDLYEKARGRGSSEIVEYREAKSIGEQNTFGQDTSDMLFIGEEFAKYCASVFDQFSRAGFASFKTIAITVRFSDFQTFTSSKSFEKPLTEKDFKKFHTEALKLLLPYLDRRKNPNKKLIRLVGVRVENFSKNLTLF